MQEGLRKRRDHGPVSLIMSGDTKHSDKKKQLKAIDYEQRCLVCHDELSVRKGAITAAYCGHVYHTYCFNRMVKDKQKQKCFCSKPLLDYDPEVIEEMKANKKVEEEKESKSCIENAVFSCARCQISLFNCLMDFLAEVHKINSSAWVTP